MFQANGVDGDIVLLEKLSHFMLTESHRVVSNVNLVRGPVGSGKK